MSLEQLLVSWQIQCQYFQCQFFHWSHQSQMAVLTGTSKWAPAVAMESAVLSL